MREIGDIPYRTRRGNEVSQALYRLRRLAIHTRTVGDIAGGLSRDLRRALAPGNAPSPDIIRNGPLFVAGETPRRLCLYAAYSPRAVVSDMVLGQLAAYRDAGFRIVFVTMSASVSAEDRARLSDLCPLVIRRASHGRDFGAWKEALALIGAESEGLDALLLTNDSNLGPVRPLAPWIASCLAMPGLFGLTESLGGGSHLQSYFLVANGGAAVADTIAFLRALRLSFSKWLMVQRGELALPRHLAARGHKVAAALDHRTLEDTLIDEPVLQTELSVMRPDLFRGIAPLPPEQAQDAAIAERNRLLLRRHLFGVPLNPSHHLASVLVRRFDFPFIKTEFVVANPMLAPSAPDWQRLAGPDSETPVAVIEAHLATLR